MSGGHILDAFPGPLGGRRGDCTIEKNGGSTALYLARTLCIPAFLLRSGSKGAFRLSGATWDHFRCTIEPLPSHVRCRFERSGRQGLSEVDLVEGSSLEINRTFNLHTWFVRALNQRTQKGGAKRTLPPKGCPFCPPKIRRVSETPTPTGIEESTAVHLQFVRQYAPHLHRSTFLASKP